MDAFKGIEGKIGKLAIGDSQPVRIMGVINLTDDSFYSSSVRRTLAEVNAVAARMEEEGADIIDLGARSTAPYKQFDISVSAETEILSDAVRSVVRTVNIPVSADTTRFEPAKAALEEGAELLNHVYGLKGADSEKIGELIASGNCCLMLTAHEDVPPPVRSGETPMDRVINALAESLALCDKWGIPRNRLTVDPGIGFFKDDKITNVEWNTDILANLERIREFSLPICVGLSRKRFLGQLIGERPPEERLSASLGGSAIAVYNGIHMLRTHDVSQTKEAALVAAAVREKRFIR